MARILTDETSLDKKLKSIVKETGTLSRVAPVLVGLGVILVVVGLLMQNRALLFAGVALAFVAVGQFVQARDNVKEKGMVGAGRSGELKVTKLLNEAFGSDTYLLNDLRVSNRRHTAQIDHLLISPSGVFVLETKNWRGALSGGAREERWTQIKGSAEKPVRLSNPILQNERHIDVLKGFLASQDIDESRIYSIIVMVSPSSTWSITDNSVPVLNIRDTIQYISYFDQPNRLSEEEIDGIISALPRT